MYNLLFTKMYILLFSEMYILTIPGGEGGGGGCVPDPSQSPLIHMDKRVHGQTEERSARWPRQTFQAGI